MTPNVKIVSAEAGVLEKTKFTVAGGGGGEGEEESQPGEVQTFEFDAAAVDIVLGNDHDQSDLITQIDLYVDDAIYLDSCAGGGPLDASAEYKFKLPTDEPLQGRTFIQKELFTVKGKEPDRLKVAVGPDHYADLEWGWIYTVTVSLHLQSGGILKADTVTLMDGGNVEQILSLKDRLDQPYANINKECVAKHRDSLNKVVQKKGSRSAAIDLLQKGLQEFDLTSAPSTSEVPTSTDSTSTSIPSSPSTEQTGWVAQVFSIEQQLGQDAFHAKQKEAEQKAGVPLVVVQSADYSAMKPGYWVGYYSKPFSDKADVQQWCDQRALTAEYCLPRNLTKK